LRVIIAFTTVWQADLLCLSKSVQEKQ
jgi:hypothetical protein